MSRNPTFTQAEVRRAEQASTVYFVDLGKFVKIGFTTNLASRIKAFETSNTQVDLMIAIPGNRALEKGIHRLLSEVQITREMFRHDWRITQFIDLYERAGLPAALQFLETSTPEARRKKKDEDRQQRTVAARQTKAEKDAYFAGLVADRIKRLGW